MLTTVYSTIKNNYVTVLHISPQVAQAQVLCESLFFVFAFFVVVCLFTLLIWGNSSYNRNKILIMISSLHAICYIFGTIMWVSNYRYPV